MSRYDTDLWKALEQAQNLPAYFNSNANANIPAQWDVEVVSNDGLVLSRRVEDYGQSEDDAALEVIQSYYRHRRSL